VGRSGEARRLSHSSIGVTQSISAGPDPQFPEKM